MAGSATFTMVVSRLTKNAARSSATRITGLDRMAGKLRRLVVNGGLKPPGADRDAVQREHPGLPGGGTRLASGWVSGHRIIDVIEPGRDGRAAHRYGRQPGLSGWLSMPPPAARRL